MRIRLAVAAGLAALALTAPTTAQAAPPAQHCVVNLAKGGATSCYTTFTAAVAAATNGRVTDAPSDPRAARGNASFRAKLDESTKKQASGQTVAPLGGIVIGIEYYHIGWAHPSKIFSGDSTCSTQTWDNEYEWDLWGDWTWNDEISSFETFANCWVDHFDLPQYQGAHLGYQPSQYYIGDTMNDRTTSLRWS